MIRRTSYAILALVLLAGTIAGCGGEREIVPPEPLTPLAVDEWRAMTDVEAKYAPATFDRLRLADPKLEDERAWQKFEKEVVGPEFQKDHPAL